MAVKAAVPPATLVRFAQQLGFAGWPQLKDAFTQELGLGSDQYGQRAKTLVGRGADGALTGEMFKVQRRNLDLTEAQNAQSLRRAAKLLERGKAVHVAGFRASFAIAFSLVYEYRLFRSAVHLVDGQGGSLEMQLRAMEKQDAVVVISFAPYSREAQTVAQAARRAGCKLIAFTDSVASPLSLMADETLLFSVHSPSFFPSIAAGLALAEALLELLVSQAGTPVVQRIDQAENQLFESGAYLQRPPLRKPV
jgi:DNA-binding MurR/RpiR family transcriptional regulator